MYVPKQKKCVGQTRDHPQNGVTASFPPVNGIEVIHHRKAFCIGILKAQQSVRYTDRLQSYLLQVNWRYTVFWRMAHVRKKHIWSHMGAGTSINYLRDSLSDSGIRKSCLYRRRNLSERCQHLTQQAKSRKKKNVRGGQEASNRCMLGD